MFCDQFCILAFLLGGGGGYQKHEYFGRCHSVYTYSIFFFQIILQRTSFFLVSRAYIQIFVLHFYFTNWANSDLPLHFFLTGVGGARSTKTAHIVVSSPTRDVGLTRESPCAGQNPGTYRTRSGRAVIRPARFTARFPPLLLVRL